MTEADILAATYDDTCTAYRPGKQVLESGETVFTKGLEGRRVYEDIPCALSTPSGGKWKRTPSVAAVDADYLLFVRPEIDIQPGDTVVVLHQRRKTIGVAGLAGTYSSHNNVPLKRLKGEA